MQSESERKHNLIQFIIGKGINETVAAVAAAVAAATAIATTPTNNNTNKIKNYYNSANNDF